MNLLANIHHSLQEHDLGLDGAEIIANALINRIEETAERFEARDQSWETDILYSLRLCKKVGEISEVARYYVLALIKDKWDDLSLEFRRNYNYNFDVLVLRETGLQPSTVDNYIRAAKTFYVDKQKPTFSVEVPVYDEYKRPVLRDGEPVTDFVEFDPTKVPITKLNLVRTLVETKKMTPRLWSMTMDSEVTVENLKGEMYKGEGTDRKEPDPSLRFSLEGDRIVATEYGVSVEIGELYFDGCDSELGRTALRRLLLILGVKYDDDVIAQKIQNARNTMIIRLYEKELNNGNYNAEGVTS